MGFEVWVKLTNYERQVYWAFGLPEAKSYALMCREMHGTTFTVEVRANGTILDA
jgi:hypothetical protein